MREPFDWIDRPLYLGGGYRQARPVAPWAHRPLRDRVVARLTEWLSAIGLTAVLLGLFALVVYGVPVVAVLFGLPLPGDGR